MRRKILLSLAATVLALLCSCGKGTGTPSYDPPQTLLYTVYSNGMVFEHCDWKTASTSGRVKLILEDGREMFVSGTFLMVSELN